MLMFSRQLCFYLSSLLLVFGARVAYANTLQRDHIDASHVISQARLQQKKNGGKIERSFWHVQEIMSAI
jgi:hypothetical protein